MPRYSQIVFLEGEEFDEFDGVLEDGGYDAALEYLKQYDYAGDYDVRDEPTYGPYDNVVHDGEYIVNVNQAVGYAGLQRVVE